MWGFIQGKCKTELWKEIGAKIHSRQPAHLSFISCASWSPWKRWVVWSKHGFRKIGHERDASEWSRTGARSAAAVECRSAVTGTWTWVQPMTWRSLPASGHPPFSCISWESFWRLEIASIGGQEAVGCLTLVIPAQPSGTLWPLQTFPCF